MPAEIRHRGHSGRANDALVLADDLRFTPPAALRFDWQKDPVAEPACVWDVYKLQPRGLHHARA